MTDAGETRISAINADATRLAGESYRTRLAPSAATEDQTRIAQQEDFQSKFARDATNVKLDDSEFFKIGDKIGERYEVSAIHHGAMGVVYGCFDHQTKLPRALKTVRSLHLHDKQVISLFKSEAAVWISLEKHPYIVRAYQVDFFEGYPYVITDYVRGPEEMEGDLRGWLGHPRMTLSVAVGMALQIAQGMQHAVCKVPNLVHRDLKPANILVNGDGKAMVTDFGLVESEQAGAGTPAYMSPEQWREDVLDARSDIYAYGCILFEMFTGHRLFHALSESDWRSAHLETTPISLTKLAPNLPSEIDNYVRRCLEKIAGTRPKNWDEVVAFFAEWYHRLTGKAVVLDFSSLVLDAGELLSACYSLGRLGRHEESLLACDRAIEINPNYSYAWRRRGYTLRDLKRYEEAIHAFNRAIKIDPEDSNPWHGKVGVLKELKRFNDANHTCDQMLSLFPNDAIGWRSKGHILHDNLNRNEEALVAYNKALEITPSDITLFELKAIIFRKLKGGF